MINIYLLFNTTGILSYCLEQGYVFRCAAGLTEPFFYCAKRSVMSPDSDSRTVPVPVVCCNSDKRAPLPEKTVSLSEIPHPHLII